MITRKYNLSDAGMLDEADVFHALYLIDEPDFNTFSPVIFSINFKTDFLAEINAARNVVKDMVIVDEQAKETKDVLKKIQECTDVFNELRFFIDRAFPNDYPVQNQFGYNDYDDAKRSQGQMLQFMEMLFITATKYSAELIAQGYTPQKIAAIGNLKEELRQQQLEQETFKKTRLLLTQQRIVILNKPWDRISDIHFAAKVIYKNNPAKLAQYELPKRNGNGGTPTPVEKIIITMATNQASPDKVLMGYKGVAGKTVDTVFGDGNEKSSTMDGIDYVLAGNTYVASGNYTITAEMEKSSLDGIVASGDMLTAVNHPDGLDAVEYDYSNNLLTSIFFLPTNTKAKKIDVSNNNLDQQSMDTMMMTANGWGTDNGYIKADGGTNATLSGQGIAAKNQLIARGWTILTN